MEMHVRYIQVPREGNTQKKSQCMPQFCISFGEQVTVCWDVRQEIIVYCGLDLMSSNPSQTETQCMWCVMHMSDLFQYITHL